MRKQKKESKSTRKCILCGRSDKLTRTPCCGQWICNDEDEYVLFSYARNSCWRNHNRYTLCGYHFSAEHDGNWKDCPECRKSFETEMYIWYGTNEYNFETLANPPPFDPTKCSKCGSVIKLGADGHTRFGDEYWCEKCSDKEMKKRMRRTRALNRTVNSAGSKSG